MGAIKRMFRLLVIGAVLLATMVFGEFTGAAIIRVDDNATTNGPTGASWSTAFNNLQDAITYANDDNQTPGSDEIWCAQGFYSPGIGAGHSSTDPNESFFLHNGISIRGGYIGPNSLGINPDTNNPALYVSYLWSHLGEGSVANVYHVVRAGDPQLRDHRQHSQCRRRRGCRPLFRNADPVDGASELRDQQ